MNGRRYRQAAKRIGNPRFRKAVISIHGIWSTGAWQAEVNPALQDADIRHEMVHYAVQALPGASRRVVARILKAYEKHRNHNPQMRISVIAHSFGTLGFGKMLYAYPDAQFERAVLYGCVMRKDFDWPDVRVRGQLRKVLHELCPADRLVRLARFFPHMGASGCEGFVHNQDDLIQERQYAHTGHSRLGTEMHAKQVWIPFILHGVTPPARRCPAAPA